MGDAACHLGSTCLSCGRFIGDEIATQGRCPHCGAVPDGVIGDDEVPGLAVTATAVNFLLYSEHQPPSSSTATASGLSRRM